MKPPNDPPRFLPVLTQVISDDALDQLRQQVQADTSAAASGAAMHDQPLPAGHPVGIARENHAQAVDERLDDVPALDWPAWLQQHLEARLQARLDALKPQIMEELRQEWLAVSSQDPAK